MDGWMDGWMMDGWMDGWMDEKMQGCGRFPSLTLLVKGQIRLIRPISH